MTTEIGNREPRTGSREPESVSDSLQTSALDRRFDDVVVTPPPPPRPRSRRSPFDPDDIETSALDIRDDHLDADIVDLVREDFEREAFIDALNRRSFGQARVARGTAPPPISMARGSAPSIPTLPRMTMFRPDGDE